MSGSPARFTTRTQGGTPRMRSNSRIADGTVFTNVTSARAGSPGSASAFSARITVPPQLNGTNISNTDKSKQIDVDASTPASSSPLKTSRAQYTNATAFRRSSATPFGLPVEPEV